MSNIWEEYSTGVIDYNEFLNKWSKIIFVRAGLLKEEEKEKFKAIGFNNKDIAFLEYLNYVFSASDKGIGTAHKYGGYKNRDTGRMLTNKVFLGHMTIEELYAVINKFK